MSRTTTTMGALTDAMTHAYVDAAERMPLSVLRSVMSAVANRAAHSDDEADALPLAVVHVFRRAVAEGTTDAPNWDAVKVGATVARALSSVRRDRERAEVKGARSIESLWEIYGDAAEAQFARHTDAMTDPDKGGRLPLAAILPTLTETERGALRASVAMGLGTKTGQAIADGSAPYAPCAFSAARFAVALGMAAPTRAEVRLALKATAALAYGAAMAAREGSNDATERGARYLSHLAPMRGEVRRLPKGVVRPDDKSTERTEGGRIRVDAMPDRSVSSALTRGMASDSFHAGAGMRHGYGATTYALAGTVRPEGKGEDHGDEIRTLALTDAKRVAIVNRSDARDDAVYAATDLHAEERARVCRNPQGAPWAGFPYRNDLAPVCHCGGAQGRPLTPFTHSVPVGQSSREIVGWAHPLPLCPAPNVLPASDLVRCGCGSKRGILADAGDGLWAHKVRPRRDRGDRR